MVCYATAGQKQLFIDKSASKSLRKLPSKQRRQAWRAIRDLEHDSRPHYSKRLVGSVNREIEVGEYRVIYRDDNEVVHVKVVGKRNGGEVFCLMDRKR